MFKHLKSILAVAIVLAIGSSFVAHAESNNLSGDKQQKIDAYIEKWRQNFNVPTVQLGILKNGELSYEKTYGEKVSSDKTFVINSMSKAMTAYGVMLLVQNGQLSLNDTVSKYLPDFAISNHNVTIRNLLNHTSGMPPFDVSSAFLGRSFDSVTGEALAVRDQAPILSSIGTFQYSDINYLFLGSIIEKVSNSDYATYMQKHVFEPLGMTKTSAFDDKNVVQGFTSAFGVNVPFWNTFSVGNAPFSGIRSNVSDIAKFLSAQMKNSPLRQQYREEMISDKSFVQYFTSPTAYQGLGWAVEPANTKSGNPSYMFHDGTGRGYQSEMSIEPSTGNGIILLSNKIWYLDDGMFIGYLFQGISDIRLGNEPAIKPNFDLIRTVAQLSAVALLAVMIYAASRQKAPIKRIKVFKFFAVASISLGIATVPLFLLIINDSITVLFRYIPDFLITAFILSIEFILLGAILLFRLKARK